MYNVCKSVFLISPLPEINLIRLVWRHNSPPRSFKGPIGAAEPRSPCNWEKATYEIPNKEL